MQRPVISLYLLGLNRVVVVCSTIKMGLMRLSKIVIKIVLVCIYNVI